MSADELINLHSELAQALHNLHKKSLETKKRLRDLSRASANRRRRTEETNFTLGDFVLVANPFQTEKLAAKWTGPYRVIELVNDLVFRVQHLLDNTTKLVHASRLTFYEDSSLNGKADLKRLKENLKHQDKFVVEKILQQRHNVSGNLEYLVQWQGFEPEDATWEPAPVIQEDVPQIVRQFHAVEQSRR
jgi:hypothetical protein